MSPPKQKPHRSVQDVRTPREFLAAVQNRFGLLTWDYACTTDNCVGGVAHGYRIDCEEDALNNSWHLHHGLGWLNPPFGKIAPFAKKAAETAAANPLWRLAMLVPASIGSTWFRKYVHGHAYVLALEPRLKFVGHDHAFPKDLILAVYQHGMKGFDTWRWDRREGA